MGKKVKARGRMRLLSMIGRFLFAWFFIFSGFKSLKEIWTDDKVKKEFTTMMVCLLHFQADTPESVIVAYACFFVAICASCKAVGGFLIMFDKIGGVCHLILYLLITTIVRCFYYYKVGEPEFVLLLQGFMQEALFIAWDQTGRNVKQKNGGQFLCAYGGPSGGKEIANVLRTRVKKWQPDALKLPLYARSGEGLDHKSLLKGSLADNKDMRRQSNETWRQ